MLRKCWSSIAQNRPKAAEIVEILARNPELITPCLDVPAASVALEDSSEMKFKGPDRARGHSFSSVWQSRKSASAQEEGHFGIFDTSQVLQTGLESAHSTKHSAFKHPLKKSLHESFKKTNRDLYKNRTVDFLPQITYL